jgi:phospholipid transport system substrate-binding protein
MDRVLKTVAAFFCFALCSVQVSPGLADDTQPGIPFEIEALDHLKLSVAQILATIQDPTFTQNPEEQEKILYARAMDLFDFKTFSLLSLGKKFQSFSNDQKEVFVYYFSKLISQTYFTRLVGKNVQNITIRYMETTPLKPKKNMLRTDVSTQISQGEKQIQITYRMMKKKSRDWKIYDIKVAGVSMAANYREQYRQQISQTPEAIITELRGKVEK